MKRTIWRFPLPIIDEVEISCPAGSQPLHVGRSHDGEASVWMLVSPDNEPTTRRFRVAGTGHPLDLGVWNLYIGSIHHGAFIWHVFDLGEES